MIRKTDLLGDHYDTVSYGDHSVNYPRPLMFALVESKVSGAFDVRSRLSKVPDTFDFPLPRPRGGADIYKIHVPTKKITRLTDQTFAPNTGAARWTKDFRPAGPGSNSFRYGVLNLGPCPLPGGRVAFVSNRHGFMPPHNVTPALQLFVMDDDGGNIECIGHLNLGMALHPVMLMDGRLMFSSLENQGLRGGHLWGLWSIHPDGTNWGCGARPR